MKVIEQIEKSFNSYLWKGIDTEAKGAKVAWDRVCSPKPVGGLGLKRGSKIGTRLLLLNIFGTFSLRQFHYGLLGCMLTY